MEERVLISMEKNLQEQFKLLLQHTELNLNEKYLKSCDSVLKLLRSKLQSANFPGTKQNYDTRIRRLKSNKAVIKNKILVGRGITQRTRKTKTYIREDVASAFDSRIRTGLITNLAHIDVGQFLDDVKSTICIRLRNDQKQFYCVKIYLVLSGEFTAKDNVDIKYFHTPTKQILLATDLDQWYQESVVHNILHQLEEFQEEKILNRQCEAHVESIVCNTTRIKFPEDIQGCWESMENDKASNAMKADDLNFCERRTRVLDQNKAELAKINNFLDSYYGLCNKHIGAVSMANCNGQ